MNQIDIFDQAAARVLVMANHHNARATDPHTSHQAGEKVERTGKAASQRAAVLKAVQALPGHTSFELANRVDIDRYVLARRLPELRKAGLVRNGQQSRECQVTGNNAMTWYAL